MREAILGGMSALDPIVAPPRKAPSRGGKPQPKPKGGGKGFRVSFRRFRNRFALIVGSAGFSAIMIGIVLNATMMQKAHHPAPLFGTAPAPRAVSAAPAHPATPVPVPVPVPAPVPHADASGDQPLVTPPAAVPAPPAAAQPVAPRKVAPAQPQPLSRTASTGAHSLHSAAVPHRAAKPEDGITRFLKDGTHTANMKPASKPAAHAVASSAKAHGTPAAVD